MQGRQDTLDGGIRRLPSLAARIRGDIALGCLDIALLASAFTFVLLLRFDGSVPRHHWDEFLSWLPIAIGVVVFCNQVFGLYRQVWRHASMHEAQRLLLSGSAALSLLLGLELVSRRVPLSVTILGTGVGTFLMAAVRFQSRLFSFRRRSADADGLRVVVIGGRDAGASLVREMLHNPAAGFTPVAVLDVDPRLHQRSVMGVLVRGDIETLPTVVKQTGAHQAVLAMSSVTPDITKRTAAAAEEAGVGLKILPDIKRRMGAGISLRELRDVRIDDLIGRGEVVTDLDAVHRLLHDQRVLVTGAGGSIGSEIARQVADCAPSALILLDHDETHLHDVASTIGVTATQVLADIRDADVIDRVLSRYHPDVVFHAAAHKHVPLLEDHPSEAVLTNVVGTRNVLRASWTHGVHRFVAISTDKAVEPANVMGASKRLSELLTVTSVPAGARACAVRFGNVLGSRGSVIPTFMRQIEAGGPVTVTDERMTRYFMSIKEAVQLVLQAATLADGGEVFVLDMGEPVRIMDLAERMIRLSGRRVGADIPIEITGPRPGEKLSEELQAANELLTATVHPAVNRLVGADADEHELDAEIERLEALARRHGPEDLRDELIGAVVRMTAPVSGRIISTSTAALAD